MCRAKCTCEPNVSDSEDSSDSSESSPCHQATNINQALPDPLPSSDDDKADEVDFDVWLNKHELLKDEAGSTK